jgi:hypothetical protein
LTVQFRVKSETTQYEVLVVVVLNFLKVHMQGDLPLLMPERLGAEDEFKGGCQVLHFNDFGHHLFVVLVQIW